MTPSCPVYADPPPSKQRLKFSVIVCMACGDYRYGNLNPFMRTHKGPFKEVDEDTLYAYLKADLVIDGRFDVARYREDNP